MITLTLFDAGETLIHEGTPFPHVAEALAVISHFTTQTGQRLKLGILSNFGDPAEVESEAQIRSLEAEFAAILGQAGIESFFQPFENRVTISARAGALKPVRLSFEAAAARAGASLPECLFITETMEHLEQAREFGLSVLGFGDMPPGLPSFSDWLEAPAQIASLVTPGHDRNFEKALSLRLKQRMGIGNFKCLSRESTSCRGQGTKMVELRRPDLGEMSGTFVEMPVDVRVRCHSDGSVASVEVDEPASEDLEEAASHVQRLARRGSVSASPDVMTPGTTHAIETDAEGRRVLVRQRYAKK